MKPSDGAPARLLILACTCIDGPNTDLSNLDRITLAGVTIASPGIGPMVRKMFMDAAQNIFNEHGQSAFESTRNATAIHEAGHVVMHTVQGTRVKSARIEMARRGQWSGFTDTYDGDFYHSPALAAPQQMLVVARDLIAGQLAEMMFDPDFREGSSLDEVLVSQLIGTQAAIHLRANGPEYWRNEVWAWTGVVLSRHQEIVKQISERLLVQGSLSGEHLQELCDVVRTNEIGEMSMESTFL